MTTKPNFEPIFQDLPSALLIGDPVRFQNLTMIPLMAQTVTANQFVYMLMDQALESGALEINEVSEAGSVPNLRAKVIGDIDVLLLDGEELIGEKQNRTLNLSILAPAREETLLPVSCVEAGRWSRQSCGFSSSNRMHFSKGRAAKMSSVSANLMESGLAESNQRQVWDDIEEKLTALSACSETAAMADAFDSVTNQIEPFVENFSPQPHQIGAVFMINDQAETLEIFDLPETFARILPKLIRSLAIDAIETVDNQTRLAENPPTSNDLIKATVKELIAKALSGSAQTFPGTGKGESVRLLTPEFEAGALVHEGNLLHLTGAFNVDILERQN